jgi:hypothetical protein
MTTEQAKGYQAYLTATAKGYSEGILMTREMREAAEREKVNRRAFAQVCTFVTFIDVKVRCEGSVPGRDTNSRHIWR